MRDTTSNTPDQAGRIDRLNASDYRDVDYDIPGVTPDHTCTSPNPDRCLVCVLDAVVAEQKAAEKARQEVIDERNREWFE